MGWVYRSVGGEFVRSGHVLTAETALSGAMLERSQYAPSSKSSGSCGEDLSVRVDEVWPQEASRMDWVMVWTSASVGDVALSSFSARVLGTCPLDWPSSVAPFISS